MNASNDHDKITRVVIGLRPGTTNTIALEEAVHMAHAFGSVLEGLFITDADLQLAGELSVARRISASGRNIARQATLDLKREIYLSSQSMRRQFDQLAMRANLRHHFKAVHEQPISAMLEACADCDDGGNLLVLSETLALRHVSQINKLLEQAQNLTGILLVGPGAERRSGPVIIVPEKFDPEKLTNMQNMITAAQILGRSDKPIIVFLAGVDEETLSLHADNLQANLKPDKQLKILTVKLPAMEPAVIIEAIRRLEGGLVIAEHGGVLVPCKENLTALATAIECPLLISKSL